MVSKIQKRQILSEMLSLNCDLILVREIVQIWLGAIIPFGNESFLAAIGKQQMKRGQTFILECAD
jgi:hypothetical protein